MTGRQTGRLEHDWHDGVIPDNTDVHPEAYLASTYSFLLYRSRLPVGLRLGRGSALYSGMFDVGPAGQVTIGDFCCLTSPFIVADAGVHIGNLCLIGYNVVLMDNHAGAPDLLARREQLRELARSDEPRLQRRGSGRPIVIGDNAWVSFDVTVLPGVQIGAGAIVRARSTVTRDVEPYTLVSGSPAVVVRRLTALDAETADTARRNAEEQMSAARSDQPTAAGR